MAGIDYDNSLLKYNGITFPPAIKIRIDTTPIKDSGNHTTKYLKLSIHTEFVVHPGMATIDNPSSTDIFPANYDDLLTLNQNEQTFDQNIRILLNRLSLSGARLELYQKGIGRWQIDTNESDILSGPHPTIVHIEPLGHNRALFVVWKCEVHVAACELSPGDSNLRITDLSYQITYDLDERGYTTRSIDGELEISNYRKQQIDPSLGVSTGNDDATLRFSPDEARERLAEMFDIPEKFQRVSQTYTISQDRRYLNFSIVDAEIRSRFPWYDGISNISAQQTVSTENLEIGEQWYVTISGTIDLTPNTPKWNAYIMLALIIRKRRQAVLNGRIVPKKTGEPLRPAFLLTADFSITDDIFGDTVSFNISWLLFVSRDYYILASGLFENLEDQGPLAPSWTRWATYNTTQSISTPRGNAELEHEASQERLSDMCGTDAIVSQFTETKPYTNPYDSSFEIIGDYNATGQYYKFEHDSEIKRDSNVIPHHLLNEPVQYQLNEFNPEINYRGASMINNSQDQFSRPILHQRSNSEFRLRVRGSAVRVGYPIPIPEISQFQSKKVRLVGTPIFRQKGKHTSFSSQKLYFAVWDQEYVFEEDAPFQLPLVTDSLPDLA